MNFHKVVIQKAKHGEGSFQPEDSRVYYYIAAVIVITRHITTVQKDACEQYKLAMETPRKGENRNEVKGQKLEEKIKGRATYGKAIKINK